jgi:SAM-dependent methyltransferase
MRFTAERDCPLCNESQAIRLPRYSTGEWNLVRCASCDFVYLKNAPDYSDVATEFVWEKSFVAAADKRKAETPVLSWVSRTTRWRLSLLSTDLATLLRRTFPPGRVLDVGCGTGQTIPEPFIPFGIEVSEAQARVANAHMAQRGGRTIQAPAIQGIAEFPDGYFSGVILRGFIEHEKNPKPLLHEVRRVLADNGVAYVRAPNYASVNRRVMGAKWCGFRHPDHVNYFTLGSLRKITADCGFILKLLSPLRLPFDDLIKAFLRKA